jgi:hypothetical protein
MGDSALAKKVGIKPGYRILILGAPPGFVEALAPLPENVTVSEQPGGLFDLVLAFFYNRADVEQQGAQALGAVKEGGLLWLCYPKQTSRLKSDLHRDTGWEAIHEADWQGVSLISIDGTWSAMRFRPSVEIKPRVRRTHDTENRTIGSPDA